MAREVEVAVGVRLSAGAMRNIGRLAVAAWSDRRAWAQTTHGASVAAGFRKHAVGWRVRSSAMGGAETLPKGEDSMLALMSHAVNACDRWQRVATGGEFRTLAAPATDFGRGFMTTNLTHVGSSSRDFPIRHALRDESDSVENRNTLRSKLPGPRIRAAVRLESHHGI
jgi:hypothetical protein